MNKREFLYLFLTFGNNPKLWVIKRNCPESIYENLRKFSVTKKFDTGNWKFSVKSASKFFISPLKKVTFSRIDDEPQ